MARVQQTRTNEGWPSREEKTVDKDYSKNNIVVLQSRVAVDACATVSNKSPIDKYTVRFLSSKAGQGFQSEIGSVKFVLTV